MNWASIGIERRMHMVAPMGSRVQLGDKGEINIVKPPHHELTKPREFGENIPGTKGQDEFILPINQSVEWLRDLYNMLWDHNMQHNLYLLFVVFLLPPNVQDN